MNIRARVDQREYLARTSLLVAVFTVILTINFVGAMALLTERVGDIDARLPYYVLLAAVVFVATILLLEESRYAGPDVLAAAITSGILGFTLIFLGGEGITFAIRNPGDILTSQLLVYFLAAAVIATGLGYWGLRHWREFTKGTGL